MNTNVDKRIKKLKGKSIIGPVLGFLFSMLFSIVFIFAMLMAIVSVIIISRYNSDSFYAHKYKEIIENTEDNKESYEIVLDEIFHSERNPYAVSLIDQKGNVVGYFGTVFNPSNKNVLELDEDLSVKLSFNDNAQEFIGNDNVDESELTLNIADIGRECLSYKGVEDIYSGDMPLFEREIFSFYYWIRTPVKNNKYIVYIKNNLSITVRDFLEILVPVCILFILLSITAIGRLIATIKSIIVQRSYLKLILSDPLTEGKNELAFDSYAYKYITSYFNRKFGYAVLDFSLAKYQNYCTLYGIEKGEKLLAAIEDVLRKNIYKGELNCHVSKGDFLILLKTSNEYPDERSLLDRAQRLIDGIARLLDDKYSNNLDGLTNLLFKAGFYYLPPVTDAVTKEKRDKKKLNIRNLCIKAQIAKDSLDEDNGLVVYNHEMWEKEIWERKVEDMMQEALEREEFHVYIQPKYNPTTQELMGGEALVRWISPTEGFISPGQFIPIFERTGFVTKLDDYMISHTAKLQSDWLSEGRNIVPISINVSRTHFAQPDLAEHIRDLVDAYPLPHKYIEIELTESAFFDDKNALLDTVHRLQSYGFEVSMDDFGSGYSSLNSLKDLPLDVLKLDADFFRGEDFEGRGEIVVAEAISLAKKLNMRIVAEGVEKKNQVDFLAKNDCDMIQGFYYAKPMPASEYEERLS